MTKHFINKVWSRTGLKTIEDIITFVKQSLSGYELQSRKRGEFVLFSHITNCSFIIKKDGNDFVGITFLNNIPYRNFGICGQITHGKFEVTIDNPHRQSGVEKNLKTKGGN